MDGINMKKEVLYTLENYLKRFIHGTEEIISLFRAGKETEALKSMKDVIDGLKWMHDAITRTQDVQLKKIEVFNMKSYLLEMVDALESMDYVLLCDLLEYEIIPILKNWEKDLSVID